MGILTINFYDGIKKEISFESLNKIGYGGTSMVYKFKINNEELLIKILTVGHSIDEFFRRIKNLRDLLININSNSLKKRTVPIGQGLINSEELGPDFNDLNENYPFLIFNYIDGISLYDYLDGEKPFSQKRISLVKQLIELLSILENKGIVHHDLFPDNFLVDAQGILYLIDLESAGIIYNRKWQWIPLVTGKTGIFPMPFELANKSQNYSLFFDKWNGLYLIFFCLFGYHPFDFLSRIDEQILENLVNTARRNVLLWPPEFIDTSNFENFLLRDRISAIRSEIKYYLYDSRQKFIRLLMNTFLNGYKNPEKRLSIKTTVKPIMEEVFEPPKRVQKPFKRAQKPIKRYRTKPVKIKRV